MTGHNFKCPPGQVSNVNGSILCEVEAGGPYEMVGLMEIEENAPLLRATRGYVNSFPHSLRIFRVG